MPILAPSPDPLMLTGVYETVLRSLRSPGGNPTADRVRVAVEWCAKAWPNTQAVQWPERLVYLKTAFEALTGTSTNWKSARKLRETFEALPHTTEKDSDILVWSHEEKPAHTRTWVDKNGQSQSTLITDLEHWFWPSVTRGTLSSIRVGSQSPYTLVRTAPTTALSSSPASSCFGVLSRCCCRNSAMTTRGAPSFGEPSMRLASVGMLSPLLVAAGAPLSADRPTDVFEGPMDSPSERGI